MYVDEIRIGVRVNLSDVAAVATCLGFVFEYVECLSSEPLSMAITQISYRLIVRELRQSENLTGKLRERVDVQLSVQHSV